MTSNPVEVDAIVKRAWQAIYEGVGGCIATAIDKFLETYSSLIIKLPEAYLPPLDAEAVQEAFSRIKESAGALDGWSPKELSLLSREMYGHIATMLTQVEAGAPWPRSSPHARMVYLEKLGAEIGRVMSFRPLTITAPLYRAWASMRLRHLEPWVREWALPEMFAGVPEMGAVDAWIQVMMELESLKLDDEPPIEKDN